MFLAQNTKIYEGKYQFVAIYKVLIWSLHMSKISSLSISVNGKRDILCHVCQKL